MSDEQAQAAPQNELQRIIEDESASAAVEFIVLIPAYLFILGALFMVGQWAMARQGVVQATRFAAFHPEKEGGQQAFFTSIDGSWSPSKSGGGGDVGQVQDQDLTLKGQEQSKMGNVGGLGGDTNVKEIAKTVINNDKGSGKPFELSSYEGTFTYDGISIPGIGSVEQRTKAATLLPKKHTRKEYEGAQQGHPGVEWGGSVIKPHEAKEAPISPEYKDHFTGKNGIWDPKSRIKGPGGQVQQERDYFKGQSKPSAQ